MTECKCKLYHAIGERCECIPPAVVLIAFLGWLTARKTEVTFGSHHECSPAVDVLTKFCDSQGWTTENINVQEWIDKLKSYPTVEQ